MGGCACAPNLGRSGKVTSLERADATLLIVHMGSYKVSLAVMLYYVIRNRLDGTFTGIRTCSSKSLRDIGPGRVLQFRA